MSYKREGDTITLQMSRSDYAVLMFLWGFALAGMTDADIRRMALEVVNRVNEGNPNYTLYSIRPEQVQ
jgi:hypothetical protein